MESTRPTIRDVNPERHFRDESEQDEDKPVKVGLTIEAPLEIHSTDEPGGDPYNHTGRFKRLYR